MLRFLNESPVSSKLATIEPSESGGRAHAQLSKRLNRASRDPPGPKRLLAGVAGQLGDPPLDEFHAKSIRQEIG